MHQYYTMALSFINLLKRAAISLWTRHQQTTSNLLRITLKDKMRISNEWSQEGALYTNLCYNYQGPWSIFFLLRNFLKYWWFQTKQLTSHLKFIKLYKQTPFEKYLIFTIIWKYMLQTKLYFGVNSWMNSISKHLWKLVHSLVICRCYAKLYVLTFRHEWIAAKSLNAQKIYIHFYQFEIFAIKATEKHRK